MAVKFTIQGLLIYMAMWIYLLAFIAFIARLRKTGWSFYIGGFAFAWAAVVYRSIEAGYVPLSNLFEVFLFLGALMLPLTVFCGRFLKIGGQAADALIAVVLLFPAGFVFSATGRQLPPMLQSPLFVPHVAAYMTAYVIIAKAAFQAGSALIKGDKGAAHRVGYEEAAYRCVCLAFPLLTGGLLLGCVWGKLAWGDWWNWDPKELWSLASWLVFVGYFHFRFITGKKFANANAALVLAGTALIIITLLWVNLSRIFAGLHSYA